MPTDAALREAGIAVGYAWDLQSCTVSMSCPAAGLDAAAKDVNRVRARSRALSDLRDQRLRQKTRRVLAENLTGEDLADRLESLGLTDYEAKPETGFVPGGRVSEKARAS